MKKILAQTIILISISASLSAQNVKNIKAKVISSENIEITYDLNNINTNEEVYKIELYSSYNNYSTPLARVSGDIGSKVSPGKGKKINWVASSEINSYDGEISFKVKATLVSAPWQVLGPQTNGTMRRGKKNTITWSGMSPGAQNVTMELRKDDKVVKNWDSVENSGKQTVELPSNLATGYYELSVNNQSGADNAKTMVRIKNKIPLVLKLSPIAIIGGAAAVYFITSGGKKEEPALPATDLVLPAPPSNP